MHRPSVTRTYPNRAMITSTDQQPNFPSNERPSDYPLDVLEFVDGLEYPAGYYSHGHHNPIDFRSAVLAYIRESSGKQEFDLEHDVIQSTPEHTWWRSVPAGVKHSDDFRLINSEPHAHGSYPVTLIHVSL